MGSIRHANDDITDEKVDYNDRLNLEESRVVKTHDLTVQINCDIRSHISAMAFIQIQTLLDVFKPPNLSRGMWSAWLSEDVCVL